MAISLIGHVAAGSSDGNSVTTGAIDTTGATFLALIACSIQTVVDAISDSKGNVWTSEGTAQFAGGLRVSTYYVDSTTPNVGSGHTFTDTGTSLFPSIFAVALSVVDPTSHQGSTNTAVGVTSIQPGSLTPAADGSLFLTGIGFQTNVQTSTPTIDAGFSVLDFVDLSPGVHYGGALAYFIQGAAGALNPTWSLPNSDSPATRMVNFLATISKRWLLVRH